MFGYSIIRRIDDLGRICIPKEMRRNFGIKEGDALQIELREGEIVIRKYNISDKKEIE